MVHALPLGEIPEIPEIPAKGRLGLKMAWFCGMWRSILTIVMHRTGPLP
jgi:hypothetical protein